MVCFWIPFRSPPKKTCKNVKRYVSKTTKSPKFKGRVRFDSRFESNDEYNEIMFLREITHTINAFNEMADVVRLYSKKPKTAEQRLANLLSEVLYEDSESV